MLATAAAAACEAAIVTVLDSNIDEQDPDNTELVFAEDSEEQDQVFAELPVLVALEAQSTMTLHLSVARGGEVTTLDFNQMLWTGRTDGNVTTL
jgi:hypothetical protein